MARSYRIEQDPATREWRVIGYRADGSRVAGYLASRKTRHAAQLLADKANQRVANAPVPGVQYRLMAGGDVPAISNGNTWAQSAIPESEVK